MSRTGQTFKERYGDEAMDTDAGEGCEHFDAQLMFVHPALDEWYCFDCHKKVRVWNSSP